MEEQTAYIHLPRGGILIPTSKGNLQFGIPPETIKDTMKTEKGVPDTFIVPHFMFDLEKGTAFAELEFPIYFNFFVQQGKTRIVCSPAQQKRLVAVVSESIFGPAHIDVRAEFIDGEATPGYPDMRAEMDFFKHLPPPRNRPMVLDDLVEFIVFDDQGRARVDGLEIRFDSSYNLEVWEQGRRIAFIDRQVPITAVPVKAEGETHRFRPPLFGITTLGSGHGFDPDASTSGMIIWLNRRGTIVDPPVNSTANLMALGVNPKLIDNVILTHCHADHDAGTLQKVLQEGKLNLYTTRTIYESFLRKSAALTGIDRSILKKLVTFFAVHMGRPMNIEGGEFRFRYTLHSIPTIAFEVKFAHKSMIYSSDTLNHPEHIENLYRKGVLSAARRDFLLAFPWDQDVIFHEAGIPPLHTPIDYLLGLPDEIRNRMYLVHVTRSSLPDGCDLRIAPTGLANTLELDVETLPYEDAVEALDVISHADVFEDLSIAKARQFLVLARQETYPEGTLIFNEGDPGDKFYMVVSGKVAIVKGGRTLTTYSNSDYFGEKSLFTDEKRTAAARALSATKLLAVKKEDMRCFIRGTESAILLQRLATHQNEALRAVLNENPFLAGLTPSQQTQLHALIQPVADSYAPGSLIVAAKAPLVRCYIIRSGKVDVYRGKEPAATLKTGDLFGVKGIFDSPAHAPFTFRAREETGLYTVSRLALLKYLDKNPGVFVRLYRYNY